MFFPRNLGPIKAIQCIRTQHHTDIQWSIVYQALCSFAIRPTGIRQEQKLFSVQNCSQTHRRNTDLWTVGSWTHQSIQDQSSFLLKLGQVGTLLPLKCF